MMFALGIDSVKVCNERRVDERDRDRNGRREEGIVECRIDGEGVRDGWRTCGRRENLWERRWRNLEQV